MKSSKILTLFYPDFVLTDSVLSRVRNLLIGFLSELLFFAKNELMSDLLKKPSNSLIFCEWPERFTHITNFGERPEWLAHITYFWWATGAICSHRSIKKEGMSKLLLYFIQIFWANRSFFVSKRVKERMSDLLRKNKQFAHSLIYHERPAHFSMSNLSDLLTVAHLSWAIWANRSFDLSDLSEGANERIPNPGFIWFFYIHLLPVSVFNDSLYLSLFYLSIYIFL